MRAGAAFAAVAGVDRVFVIEAMPRTFSGKVNKHELIRQLETQALIG